MWMPSPVIYTDSIRSDEDAGMMISAFALLFTMAYAHVQYVDVRFTFSSNNWVLETSQHNYTVQPAVNKAEPELVLQIKTLHSLCR